MVNLTPSLKEVREALKPWANLAKQYGHLPKGKPFWISFAPSPWANTLTIDEIRTLAALYDALLTAQAEANVYAIRPWDAPGFEACVKEEKERLSSEGTPAK